MAKATFFQKPIPKDERVFYYDSETDDPIQTKEQEAHEEFKLPEDYEYVPKNPLKKLWAAIVYRVFVAIGYPYELGYWGLKIHGKEKFKKVGKSGYMMYCNHTNPFHDVFGPGVAANRRIYTVISGVQLLLPGIGKFLGPLGGLPLGTSAGTKKRFHEAVDHRLKQGNAVTVYPEAHLWPYATKIRKFPQGDRAFVYAVRNNVPCFALTTTYRKSGKEGDERPRMDMYVDGPFYPDPSKSDDENRAMLAGQVYASMVKYSKKNSYEYFQYRPRQAKKS